MKIGYENVRKAMAPPPFSFTDNIAGFDDSYKHNVVPKIRRTDIGYCWMDVWLRGP